MSKPIYTRTPSDGPLFRLGRIVATPGAIQVLRQTNTEPEALLMKHVAGDWGEVCKEDADTNRLALENGYRLMSVYLLPVTVKKSSDQTAPQKTIWLITEADRSVTTFLLPREY